MGRSKKVEGTCSICGTHGKLTFEHIPPESAFNGQSVLAVDFEQMVGAGVDGPVKGRISQRGSGGYTLCPKCNNDTGSWYASDYASWCHQAMALLVRSQGRPSLSYPYYIYPLRIIKQIISMFCSVIGPGFASKNSDLVSFLLNRERMYLDPKFAVYTYLNIEGRSLRRMGITGMGGSRGIKTLSEISSPPFGYVLSLSGGPPDPRLIDISFFTRFTYNDFRPVYLRLPVLATHLWLPGDYRTKEEITRDYLRNMAQEAAMKQLDQPKPDQG